jgi:D-alanyl-lipoteichoic acid acyltransferase DltB (MBOAT superfamily)
MSITNILIITAACLIGGRLLPFKVCYWFVFCASILGIFILQPVSPIHNLSFWFPLIALSLTIFVWAITQREGVLSSHSNIVGGILVTVIIGIIAISRYINPICCITPERPPQIATIIIVVLVIIGLTWTFLLHSKNPVTTWSLFIIILLIFVILKLPWLTEKVSIMLRIINRQDVHLASSLDLYWLGYSYLAFRLLHVLRDFQSGRLTQISLSDFICYTLYLPSYVSGPIDRSQHFISELNQKYHTPTAINTDEYIEIIVGCKRIIRGIFKKFVLADTLALIALNSQNALKITSSFWLWVILYAYTLRIYFDFSGYTDIAIGISKLLGITLPENFESPYLKTSLISFWNSWHITLAQWFRTYFFYPLTRKLRLNFARLPFWIIIMIGQLATMLLIGLWHGLSWNFAIWGVWHGFGLFINNRWSAWIKRYSLDIFLKPGTKFIAQFLGWLLTFNFVALGWVWFILPDLGNAFTIFLRLFGKY